MRNTGRLKDLIGINVLRLPFMHQPYTLHMFGCPSDVHALSLSQLALSSTT